VILAGIVGVFIGLVAGYARGALSFVLMRLVDVILAFPGILIALVVVTVLGPGLINIAIAIGISFLPAFARVVFAATLSAKGQDYVLSARSIGCSTPRILLRHIIPNVAPQIIVIASGAIGWAALTATTLSFLGFGLALPTADWGSDLSAGQQWVAYAWWIPTFPGLAISLLILAANNLGDFLNQALSPRKRLATAAIGAVDA
jgi:ABC-type dipeptide/oligopeptide/nickel transport system permease subunit